MCEILKKEIPKYMHEIVLHASYYSTSRKHRSVLVLLSNLHFCEVKSGQLLHEINLEESILKDCILPSNNFFLKNDRILGIEEVLPSPSKCTGYSQNEEINKNICFGKYISTNLSEKNVYILIHFKDKLIVLLKQEDFKIHREFENVEFFRIRDENKSACMEICFFEGERLNTDFSELNLETDIALDDFEQLESFKQILNKISTSNSELLVHKNITKKDFFELKNSSSFGCNKIRSNPIEEKQMLSKCGDVWWRITPTDVMVIGIPVVNNCSKRLKPLRNIRPVLISSEHHIEYEYSLYKLSANLIDLNNIETFFESEDRNDDTKIDFQSDWIRVENEILEPEVFGVVLIKIKMSLLLIANMLTNFRCFILYEVIDGNTLSNIEIQLFVKEFSFATNVADFERLRVKFTQTSIHGDLVSLASTVHQTSFQIEFESAQDSVIYEIHKQFINSLEFTLCCKEDNNSMDIDFDEIQQIYYNKEKGNFWYGSLIRTYYTTSQPNTIYLKLYTQKEKTLVFVKFLYENLNKKCKISKISHPINRDQKFTLSLKDSLKLELDKQIEYCLALELGNDLTQFTTEKRSRDPVSRQHLIEAELLTDLIIKNEDTL